MAGHALKIRQTLFVKYRYAVLLATLLLVYGLYPFIETFPRLRFALNVALALMMAAAISAVRHRRWVFIGSIVLGLLTLTSSALYDAGVATGIGGLVLLFRGAFTLTMIVALLEGIAHEDEVTMNAVYGVGAIYLLMALTWATAYTAIERADPAAFRRPEVALRAGVAKPKVVEDDLLYFSLITMTTVGYGDIAPASPAARTLASLQGLIGQLFVAIFLARMVSLEVSNRMARKRGPGDG